MLAWTIEFRPEAEKDLAGLDRRVRKRIIAKIGWLGSHFDAVLPFSLTGEFKDFYKLRVGDWRVFYQVDWHKRRIAICYIERRDKAYKKG